MPKMPQVFLVTTFTVMLFASPVSSMAADPPEPHVEVQRPPLDTLFRELDTKRSLAEQELSQLPQRVEQETARIMSELDRLFRDRLPRDFDAHHREVAGELEQVGLPPDVGAIRVIWEQAKSPITSSGLESLASDFVSRAQRQTDRQREALQERIGNQVQSVLEQELDVAQKNIREPIQKLVGRYFPAWVSVPLPPPPLPVVDVVVDGPQPVQSAALLISGILLIVLRRMIRRIVLKISAKIAGKVVAKLIPLIGLVLLAISAWDAIRARGQLEAEFRSTFLQVYREEFTARTVWETVPDESSPSLKRAMEQRIREQLQAWEQHCRAEAQRMLDAARAVSMLQGSQDYLQEQHAKGRDTREVAEELARLDKAFGTLLPQASIDDFFSILVDWPTGDHRKLRQLADELDLGLITGYRQHGRSMLVAAHRIGPRLFIELFRHSDQVDWREMSEALLDYGDLLQNEHQKRGVLLLLEQQIDHRSLSPALLEEVGRDPDLFRFAAAELASDRMALLQVFADARSMTVLRTVHAEYPALASAMLACWPATAWQRYDRQPERLKALVRIARYRAEEQDRSLIGFAEGLTEEDNLTPIAMDVGLDGIRIWDALVGDQTGSFQRQQVETAISLYKQGIPADRLLTSQDVQIASHFSQWPVLGIWLVEWVQPLGAMAYMSFYGAVLAIGLLGFVVVRWFAFLMWPRRVGKRR